MFLLYSSVAIGLGLLCFQSGSACDDLIHDTSVYNVTTITPATQSWLDVKAVCDSSGGQLASLTTKDVFDAVLEYLRNCHQSGRYAIGLSSQAGLDKDIYANWVWETGEAHDGIIPWSTNDIPVSNAESGGVRLKTSDGTYFDIKIGHLMDVWTPGYVCEYSLALVTPYFRSLEPSGGCRSNASGPGMGVDCLRCSLKCNGNNKCLAFYVDDDGCHLETVSIQDNRYYNRVYKLEFGN